MSNGQSGDKERTRTITWDDPKVSARALMKMSGLEWMNAIKDGELPRPPVADLLGYRVVEVSPGRTVFEVETGEWLYNPIGTVHGGVLATLMDSAMGSAVHTMLPRGAAYTTVEFKVNFVEPVTSGVGLIRAESRAIHVGGRIATAEARIVDENRKLYAHAVTTCMVIKPKG